MKVGQTLFKVGRYRIHLQYNESLPRTAALWKVLQDMWTTSLPCNGSPTRSGRKRGWRLPWPKRPYWPFPHVYTSPDTAINTAQSTRSTLRHAKYILPLYLSAENQRLVLSTETSLHTIPSPSSAVEECKMPSPIVVNRRLQWCGEQVIFEGPNCIVGCVTYPPTPSVTGIVYVSEIFWSCQQLVQSMLTFTPSCQQYSCLIVPWNLLIYSIPSVFLNKQRSTLDHDYHLLVLHSEDLRSTWQ